MFTGKSSASACQEFLKKHSVHPSKQNEFCGIPVSSLGIGTYLGPMDEPTDAKVTSAVVKAVELGCNFIDTAVNYRGQRAERSIGEAIRRLVLSGKAKREELFISSKAGFVPMEGTPEKNMLELFNREYVQKGFARTSDLIAGCHCLSPSYLLNQLERSRKNLQVETIDLYYVHNPETQLEELPERVFLENLEQAFEALEKAALENKIGGYGLATWDAFRDEPTSQFSLQLEKIVAVAAKAAAKVGSTEHHFKAIQFPLNLAMPEGALLRTQKVGNQMYTPLEAAEALMIDVAVSVPLFQSRLCHGLPDFILENFPSEWSQAHCALGFVTGFSKVSSALVGMKQPEHVEHNLEFLKMPGIGEEKLMSLINAMVEK